MKSIWSVLFPWKSDEGTTSRFIVPVSPKANIISGGFNLIEKSDILSAIDGFILDILFAEFHSQYRPKMHYNNSSE